MRRRVRIILTAGVVGFVYITSLATTLSREGQHADIAPGIAVTELRAQNANSWLVHDRSDPMRALLIDSGVPGGGFMLAERMEAMGIAPVDLDAVILTHSHYDHAGGARYFQQTFGVPVIMGDGDADVLETGGPQPVCPTSRLARSIRLPSDDPKTWSLSPDRVVADTLPLSELGWDGQLRVVGGHTPGSLVVVIGNAVFVGDLVRGRIVGWGPAVHFFMRDLVGNASDLGDLLDDLPKDVTRIFPGHMSPFDRSELRRHVDGRLSHVMGGKPS